MNKDGLGNELKTIMVEETQGIEMSLELKDKILPHRKRTLRYRIKDFLNKGIEIPLIPMVASLALVMVMTGIPGDLMINKSRRIVDVGSSQIIFREESGVGRND